jgi:hypothetical protein
METELGEKVDERCSACASRDEECWKYSAKGAQQVSRPGDSCARCRVTARTGGCSLSTRKRRRDEPDPPSRPPPGVLPKGGPPNGGSGWGVLV